VIKSGKLMIAILEQCQWVVSFVSLFLVTPDGGVNMETRSVINFTVT